MQESWEREGDIKLKRVKNGGKKRDQELLRMLGKKTPFSRYPEWLAWLDKSGIAGPLWPLSPIGAEQGTARTKIISCQVRTTPAGQTKWSGPD
jgi:hypothetical protein